MSIRTNFKKFLVIAVLALITLVIVGCKKKVEDVVNLATAQAEKIHLADADKIIADFPLPKFVQGNKDAKITWVSDKPEYVQITEYSAEQTDFDATLYYLAKVTLPNEKIAVNLTATVTVGEHVAIKKVELGVGNTYTELSVTNAKAADKGTLVKVDGTVIFVSDSGYAFKDETGFMYVYGSNHGRKIGEKVVVRGATDVYNFMPQLSKAGAEKVGDEATGFDPATLAEEITLGDIIKHDPKDKNFFSKLLKISGVVRKTTNANVPYEIYNPFKLGEFVGVSKYTSASSLEILETNKGKYIEANVITYDNRDAKFNVLFPDVAPKVNELTYTDQNKADLSLEVLQMDLNGTIVTGNMDLKATVEAYGATIVWTSGNAAVIDNTGKVTMPESDTKVTLTIVSTFGDKTATGTVEVTVKKLSVSKINTLIDLTPAKVADAKPLVLIEGKVIGWQYNGYWVADETGAMLVFTGAVHSEAVPYPAVGSMITVKGSLATYADTNEFTVQISPQEVKASTATAPTTIAPLTQTFADLIAYKVETRDKGKDAAKALYGKFITIQGKVRGSGNFWYIDSDVPGQFFRLNSLFANTGLEAGKVVKITVMVRDFYYIDDTSDYNNYKKGCFGGVFFQDQNAITVIG
jgi:hypothetical protein